MLNLFGHILDEGYQITTEQENPNTTEQENSNTTELEIQCQCPLVEPETNVPPVISKKEEEVIQENINLKAALENERLKTEDAKEKILKEFELRKTNHDRWQKKVLYQKDIVSDLRKKLSSEQRRSKELQERVSQIRNDLRNEQSRVSKYKHQVELLDAKLKKEEMTLKATKNSLDHSNREHDINLEKRNIESMRIQSERDEEKIKQLKVILEEKEATIEKFKKEQEKWESSTIKSSTTTELYELIKIFYGRLAREVLFPITPPTTQPFLSLHLCGLLWILLHKIEKTSPELSPTMSITLEDADTRLQRINTDLLSQSLVLQVEGLDLTIPQQDLFQILPLFDVEFTKQIGNTRFICFKTLENAILACHYFAQLNPGLQMASVPCELVAPLATLRSNDQRSPLLHPQSSPQHMLNPALLNQLLNSQFYKTLSPLSQIQPQLLLQSERNKLAMLLLQHLISSGGRGVNLPIISNPINSMNLTNVPNNSVGSTTNVSNPMNTSTINFANPFNGPNLTNVPNPINLLQNLTTSGMNMNLNLQNLNTVHPNLNLSNGVSVNGPTVPNTNIGVPSPNSNNLEQNLTAPNSNLNEKKRKAQIQLPENTKKLKTDSSTQSNSAEEAPSQKQQQQYQPQYPPQYQLQSQSTECSSKQYSQIDPQSPQQLSIDLKLLKNISKEELCLKLKEYMNLIDSFVITPESIFINVKSYKSAVAVQKYLVESNDTLNKNDIKFTSGARVIPPHLSHFLVCNLDQKTTPNEIKQLLPSNPSSLTLTKGEATVIYTSPAPAEKAVLSLCGKSIRGRELVCFYIAEADLGTHM